MKKCWSIFLEISESYIHKSLQKYTGITTVIKKNPG